MLRSEIPNERELRWFRIVVRLFAFSIIALSAALPLLLSRPWQIAACVDIVAAFAAFLLIRRCIATEGAVRAGAPATPSAGAIEDAFIQTAKAQVGTTGAATQ